MSDDEEGPSVGKSLMLAYEIASLPQTILTFGGVAIAIPTMIVLLTYEMILEDPVFGGGAVILVAVSSLSLTGALVWRNWAKKRRWAALAEEDEEKPPVRQRPRARDRRPMDHEG